MKTVAAAAIAGIAAATVYPTFPVSWSSFVESDILQAQGSFNDAAGNVCCSTGDVQCQVQVQAQANQLYIDGLNNQTSAVFGPNAQNYAIVSVWKINKEIAVDENFACQAYCPLDEGRWENYNVDGSTDMGATVMNGQTVHHYQSTQIIPLVNITAEIDDIYVIVTNTTAGGMPSTAIPFLEVDTILPSENLGTSNTTYSSFLPGQPDAKWFAVTGVADCPQAKDCNSNVQRQMARLATGRSSSFIKAALRTKQAEARKMLKSAQALVAALESEL